MPLGFNTPYSGLGFNNPYLGIGQTTNSSRRGTSGHQAVTLDTPVTDNHGFFGTGLINPSFFGTQTNLTSRPENRSLNQGFNFQQQNLFNAFSPMNMFPLFSPEDHAARNTAINNISSLITQYRNDLNNPQFARRLNQIISSVANPDAFFYERIAETLKNRIGNDNQVFRIIDNLTGEAKNRVLRSILGNCTASFPRRENIISYLNYLNQKHNGNINNVITELQVIIRTYQGRNIDPANVNSREALRVFLADRVGNSDERSQLLNSYNDLGQVREFNNRFYVCLPGNNPPAGISFSNSAAANEFVRSLTGGYVHNINIVQDNGNLYVQLSVNGRNERALIDNNSFNTFRNIYRQVTVPHL